MTESDFKQPAWKSYRDYAGEFGIRYGGRATVLPRVEERIRNAFYKVKEQKESSEIIAVDFGCGTGRYVGVLQRLAAEGFNIRYVGVDIDDEMLKGFETNLDEHKFKRTGGRDLTYLTEGKNDPAYLGPCYEQGNVHV